MNTTDRSRLDKTTTNKQTNKQKQTVFSTGFPVLYMKRERERERERDREREREREREKRVFESCQNTIVTTVVSPAVCVSDVRSKVVICGKRVRNVTSQLSAIHW